jgi:hypothetical protein
LSHTPCKYDSEHKKIVFSKCTIKNDLSPAQWRHNPWQGRKFTQPFVPQTYNYFDYQKAWYIPFSFRITAINILGFLPLIRFMKLKICLYGLMNSGSFLELKLVLYILPFATNY